MIKARFTMHNPDQARVTIYGQETHKPLIDKRGNIIEIHHIITKWMEGLGFLQPGTTQLIKNKTTTKKKS